MTSTPTAAARPEIDPAAIDTIFAEWDSTHSPGCAVGIYMGSELLFARGYGMSNLEHSVPISPRSIFHVASISKQFTDYCIALLARAGHLNPDDDVRTYIPEVPDFGPVITLRHLIHHTSGLRDQWSLLDYAGWREDDLITEADVLDVVQRQTALNFAPGERHLYCNTGYTLLAMVVHRVSGKTLRQFAQEHIFGPLGMTSTHFHDNHREIVPGRTQAYEWTRDHWEVSIPVFDVVGTTSLFTTVEDLAKWHGEFAVPVVGDAALRELVETRGKLNDGSEISYAWGLSHDTFRDAEVIGHSGADAGYRAQFMRLPQHNLGVAVLANFDRAAPSRLAEQVLSAIVGDRLTAEPEQPQLEAPVATAVTTPLDAFAGLYQSADGSEFIQFFAEETGLTAGIQADKREGYTRAADREFRLARYTQQITRFDDGEPASGFKRSYASVDEETHFTRITPPALSTEELAAFAGAYTCPEIGVTYVVSQSDSGLELRRRKHPSAPMVTVAPDRFMTDAFWGGPVLSFTRTTTGEVDGFTIGSGRVVDLRFNRDSTGWI